MPQSSGTKTHQSRPFRPRGLICLGSFLAATVLGIMMSAAAVAQDIDPRSVTRGKSVYAVKATCARCHGWSGDGRGAPRQPSPSLSLRETALDREGLIEVVQCGRPATRMPHHDNRAYRDDRCYGATARDLGRDKPERANNPLPMRDIESVVDYLLAKVVGRGAITVAECEEYFEPGAKACGRYAGN